MPLTALPPVIGHRCARAFAPENTLAGLSRAAALRGSWAGQAVFCEAGGSAPGLPELWVEIDVRLTADGVPVLLHDDTLERTTDGHGAVAEAAWTTVQRLDAGRWFDRSFAGERVPTLDAFLRAALDLGIGVNLELKEGPGDGGKVAEAALTVARDLWQPGAPGAGAQPPLITSFASDVLEAAARVAPDWPRGLLLDRIEPDWTTRAHRAGATALVVNHRCLASEAAVAALAAPDRTVLVYTVNDPARAAQLRDWGVAAIITDRPDAEMAMAAGAGIRLAENNFIYGSMVTSCEGRGHNQPPGAAGPAPSVAGTMIGRVP
jgi:glycerophosphoryl diester phosphodiesterase